MKYANKDNRYVNERKVIWTTKKLPLQSYRYWRQPNSCHRENTELPTHHKVNWSIAAKHLYLSNTSMSSVKKRQSGPSYWRTLLLLQFPKITTVLMASGNKKTIYLQSLSKCEKSSKYPGKIISKRPSEKISQTTGASQDGTLYMLKW